MVYIYPQKLKFPNPGLLVQALPSLAQKKQKKLETMRNVSKVIRRSLAVLPIGHKCLPNDRPGLLRTLFNVWGFAPRSFLWK